MIEEQDLNQLRHIEPPPPSNEAKQQAINMACEAFTTAKNSQAKKEQKKFQGFERVKRIIHVFNQKLWSFIMKKQIIGGTVLTSVLAVAVTTFLWQQDEQTIPLDSLASTSPEPTKADTVGFKKSGRIEARREQEIASQATEPTQVQAATAPVVNPPAKAKVDIKTELVRLPATPAIAAQPVSTLPSKPTLADNSAGQYQDKGRDQFEKITPNPVKKVFEEPVSTFSIDVDTASYAFTRNALNKGKLPQKNAVRVEELINYFDYAYPLPKELKQPFKPTIAVYPTPWNQHTKLLHIGIKGHNITLTEKPHANLVFLLDVSGSMNHPDKLPLLKNAFSLLVENLSPEDTVAIVTYAGRAATVLEPTQVKQKAKVLAALDQLQSGGSTAGAQGIKQAYALAEQNFNKEGVNRVILATDGDFNIGITNREELKSYIERKREVGIFLSVLGFGQGNYNDALMQILAQNGNGNAAYIDTLNEARKVLVDEASSTLYPIAKDVKIQIEFNPNRVSEYRLIGYETRLLNREDFNNDKVDAGDIGSGHTVTAIYEITPTNSEGALIDNLRYQQDTKQEASEKATEYAFLKLRYKLPDSDISQLIEVPINKEAEATSITATTTDIRFAASVAAFGQLLRGGQYLGDFSFDDIIALAKDARGTDEYGYRAEFINLVRLAKSARAM
ncbi:VWA domain-containing protein [Endozoicomonas sp. SM1973]|uniref:VWA domain-containing protein n=1 Tax=Spartinivicinus marinus TaxID=2994442 RepID=A0A853I447_9GAMM|nr:VWA domain-containing protein [Spartinivicinus marinus]MCX4024681.1 VWA domain-containing protein [Spartinivicinus marinus]NYZ66292.1 VWA domain-containing protein [Spartinivicinus marinus]